MDTTQKQSTMDDVIQELEKKEQVDALYYLVQKLPDFVSRVQTLDDKLEFIENVIEDKQSLSTISNEIEEKMENFLKFYKTYKKNCYKPSEGIENMYPYEIIEKVFIMNKNDENINDIVNYWKTRKENLNFQENLNDSFRIEKSDLL